MKQTVLILSFCISSFFVHSQTNIDSLIFILENNKLPAAEQVSIYNKICSFSVNSDPEKALLYSQKALSFAEKEKNNLWISIFSTHTGKAYELIGDYDTSLDYCMKGLRAAIDSKTEHQQAFAYSCLASVRYRQGYIVTSLDLFLKALSIYEKIDDDKYKSLEVHVLTNIGEIYRYLKKYDTAFPYLEKAMIIAEELDYVGGKLQIYYDIGYIYKDKKEHEKALYYLSKTLETSRLLGNKYVEGAVLGTLALISADIKDAVKSEQYVGEAFSIAEKINNPALLLYTWNIIAEINIIQKKYIEGEAAAISAWQIDTTNVDMAPDITYNIGLANLYLGNKEKAALFFNKSKEATEKLSNKDFNNLLIDAGVKYENEKKEMRIATLEKEKQLYIWLGAVGVALFLLAYGVLFFRHRLNIQKRKNAEQQKELAEKQKELAEKQMTLSEQQREIAEQKNMLAEQQIKQLEKEKQLIATQAILDGEVAERTRLAKDLHNGLGGLLTVTKLNLKKIGGYSFMEQQDVSCFEIALGLLDQSVVELRRIAHHLMPLSLLNDGLRVAIEDFCKAIPIAKFQYYGGSNLPRLDNRLEIVLYQSTYELVNNAVKYSDATTINVQLIIDDRIVSLTIQDNGKGFDPDIISDGTGLENLRTHILAYNGKMNIHSSPGNGTEICIEIENTGYS